MCLCWPEGVLLPVPEEWPYLKRRCFCFLLRARHSLPCLFSSLSLAKSTIQQLGLAAFSAGPCADSEGNCPWGCISQKGELVISPQRDLVTVIKLVIIKLVITNPRWCLFNFTLLFILKAGAFFIAVLHWLLRVLLLLCVASEYLGAGWQVWGSASWWEEVVGVDECRRLLWQWDFP